MLYKVLKKKKSTRNGTCCEKKSKEQKDYLINKDVSEDNQIFGLQ